MSTKTYRGGCHCGKVKFEAQLDLNKGGGRCNCSMCLKSRNWSSTIKPEAFKLISGQSEQSDYQFNTKSTHNYFCKTCGVRSYTEGDVPEIGGRFFSVRLNCLELSDEEFEQLAKAPTRFSNGRDNDWMHEPKVKAHL